MSPSCPRISLVGLSTSSTTSSTRVFLASGSTTRIGGTSGHFGLHTFGRIWRVVTSIVHGTDGRTSAHRPASRLLPLRWSGWSCFLTVHYQVFVCGRLGRDSAGIDGDCQAHGCHCRHFQAFALEWPRRVVVNSVAWRPESPHRIKHNIKVSYF
jgi:hypothetical protein